MALRPHARRTGGGTPSVVVLEDSDDEPQLAEAVRRFYVAAMFVS
jgi:hypothetical protein